MADHTPDQTLVLVVHAHGHHYENAVDIADANGGRVDDVVKYLSAWDAGEETDGAAKYNGGQSLTFGQLLALPHQVHTTDTPEGYILQLDHQLGFYALYRPPVSEN